MWISRELNKVLLEFTPLGRVTKLPDTTAGVDELSGLIEDIRTAVMDYQVCPRSSRMHYP